MFHVAGTSSMVTLNLTPAIADDGSRLCHCQPLKSNVDTLRTRERLAKQITSPGMLLSLATQCSIILCQSKRNDV